ncbi:uncharacterized protein LOC144139108 [Haemaphysalis longicornis]
MPDINGVTALRRKDSIPEPENAEAYDVNVERYAESHAQILDKFHLAFRRCGSEEHQQYIDIGCGPGSFTLKYLLPRCLPCRLLVAVDRKESMVKHAAQTYPHPKLKYAKLDIEKNVGAFVQEHGLFHRVYSFLTLYLMKGLPLALRNIEKLLVMGGECLLMIESDIDIFHYFAAILKSGRWARYSHMLELPKTWAIEDVHIMRSYTTTLLDCTSLVPLASEVFTLPALQRLGPEKILGTFISFNPIYLHLDEEEKKKLVSFTRDFIKTMLAGSSGVSTATRSIFVVHAWKPSDQSKISEGYNSSSAGLFTEP